MQDIGIAISLVLLAATLCQWLAWRVRLPAILFLLITGFVVGPVTGWLDPDAMFGDLLMPMVSLSVAIILFEGSLTLNLSEIRGVGQVVQRMITIGAAVTWLIVAVATHLIFGFSWQLSALFGAIVIVTGPTVIVPMLRSVRPTAKIANILRWEGIAIDPVGALAAVMTYEFIIASAGQTALGHVAWLFLQTLLAGLLLGIGAGWLLGQLLSRNLLPDYLHNLATLSLVLVTFSVSNALMHESGLLAVTVMGLWLANRREVDIHPILNFKEHLSLLLISMLFIVLAARIDLQQLMSIAGQAALLLLVLQFIARPAKILVSTIGLDVSWPERGLLAWIAPRGIVAAAIAAIFGEKLVAAGYAEAALLLPLTFAMIIGTVVLQSATSRFVAKGLGVAEPSPRGFLIIGANAFARALAQELTRHEFRCVIADTNWEQIRLARMEGLETYYGNPVSEHAEMHLDLSGIGGLLGLSRQRHLNLVSAMHFQADFGTKRIFSLVSKVDQKNPEKLRVSSSYTGNKLFGEDISYTDLVSLVGSGSEVKSTRLSAEFDWATYQTKYRDSRLPLLVIDPKGLVFPFTAEQELAPKEESIVIALAVTDSPEPQVHEAKNIPLPG
ncbi:sodium:proton antiporter [Halieaceae bacterium IMCC14734]|uniref:Sodium:proton antiporter n=1 Tax=Candidatus Litorirhabdus singularis TaxID=2518993 RepID=A0ABT3TDC7_9GAMM|nr:sodium:proton antiporter [Candidatus Litorirhabdus singularis]MCX2980190.1 sodium:proton antiporter [Candidatus Litorirhabdus singularis]